MAVSLLHSVVLAASLAASIPGSGRAETGAPVAGPPRHGTAPSRPDRAWTLSVGTGAGGLVEFADGFVGEIAGGLAGYATERHGRFQANARVDREHGRWVRTGVAYTYQRWTTELFSAPGVSQGTIRDSVHVLVADFTVRWIRGRDVELYSAAAAGGAVRREHGTVGGVGYGSDDTGFAFQLRLLGLSLGGEQLRAFAEVGIGFEGLILGGLALRF